MTVLAATRHYLAEYESGQLTISRAVDGRCVAFEGRGVAGQFRECLKTHGPERTVAKWVLWAEQRKTPWQPPLYKPAALARLIEENAPCSI